MSTSLAARIEKLVTFAQNGLIESVVIRERDEVMSVARRHELAARLGADLLDAAGMKPACVMVRGMAAGTLDPLNPAEGLAEILERIFTGAQLSSEFYLTAERVRMAAEAYLMRYDEERERIADVLNERLAAGETPEQVGLRRPDEDSR